MDFFSHGMPWLPTAKKYFSLYSFSSGLLKSILNAQIMDVMEIQENDENISTLLAMGFPEIGEIKRALRLAKNDMNEAVAILTNDQSVSSYGPVADLNIDVDMKESGASKSTSDDINTADVCIVYDLFKGCLLILAFLNFTRVTVIMVVFLKLIFMNWNLEFS